MSTLEIKRLDPTTLKPDRIIILLGARGKGKSTLLYDIMYHMRNKLHSGIAMTPTADSISTFQKFMPSSFIYHSFNDMALQKTMDAKEILQDKNGGEEKDHRYIFILLDDIMYDKSALKSVRVRKIFMNGRHHKIFFVNLMQYCMDMGPDLRANIDYVFALQDTNISNRIKLWKYFFGMFGKFDHFARVMDNCTQNRECLVLDNTVNSNNPSDKLFWYNASINIPPFRVGVPSWWLFDWKYGKEFSKGRAGDIINKEIMDTFKPSKDKDRLTHTSSRNKQSSRSVKTMVARSNGSIIRKRGPGKLEGVDLTAFDNNKNKNNM